MTISIVMATYNGEKYLTEQLDSLRLQTRPADEVIIQDDGSTDGTVQLVQDYIKKYDLSATWNFTCNEHNLGYAENFKTATLKSKGDLIFFCDQDDIWELNRLSLTEKIMIENPNINVLCCRFKPFISGSNVDTSVIHDTSREIYDCAIEKVDFNYSNMFLASVGSAMVIRRNFINENLQYWYNGFAHDEFAWKIGLCKESVYWYRCVLLNRRHHSGNVSMRKMRNLNKRITYLEDLLKSYNTMKECLEAKPINNKASKIVSNQIKAVQLRYNLLKNRKIFNVIPLLFKYRKTYQTVKTIPMELYMAIFRKKYSKV